MRIFIFFHIMSSIFEYINYKNKILKRICYYKCYDCDSIVSENCGHKYFGNKEYKLKNRGKWDVVWCEKCDKINCKHILPYCDSLYIRYLNLGIKYWCCNC